MVGFYAGAGKELSQYVRQMAWLASRPDKAPPKEQNERPSRLEQMKADGIQPDIPNAPFPHLARWLFEVGPTVSTGMGPAIIGWQDLAAWQSITGVELQPWEARALRQMSGEYIAMMQDAKDPTCPAPFISKEAMERNRKAVSDKIRAGFAARKG